VVACLGRVICFISLPTDMTICLIHSLAVMIFSPGKHGAVQHCESRREGQALRASYVAEDVFHGFIAATRRSFMPGPRDCTPYGAPVHSLAASAQESRPDQQ
jgi:hypothetical protein